MGSSYFAAQCTAISLIGSTLVCIRPTVGALDPSHSCRALTGVVIPQHMRLPSSIQIIHQERRIHIHSSSMRPHVLGSSLQDWRYSSRTLFTSLTTASDGVSSPAAQSLAAAQVTTTHPATSGKQPASFTSATERQEHSILTSKSRICHQPGCGKWASFNTPNIPVPLYCAVHKLSGMVNVRNQKRCEAAECSTRPVFNVEGQKSGRFCIKHRHPGMIDVSSRTCEDSSCRKQPSFNAIGESQGRFCSAHRHPGMVDVKCKSCEEALCFRVAYYNVDGEVLGRFCKWHKGLEMVNVVTKPCEHGLCRIKPTYNWSGESRGVLCVAHKQPGMIDVLGKLCEAEGCSTYPPLE